VAIWVIQLEAGAEWELPADTHGLSRRLYFFEGESLRAAGTEYQPGVGLELDSSLGLPLVNGAQTVRLLLLQGAADRRACGAVWALCDEQQGGDYDGL
jgi:redox-sensitive bicupin YhaK (pirin superfamily)